VARRGTRAIPSASDLRQCVIEFGKGRLRLGGTRYKSDAGSENGDADQPHEHFVWDGWRESS